MAFVVTDCTDGHNVGRAASLHGTSGEQNTNDVLCLLDPPGTC